MTKPKTPEEIAAEKRKRKGYRLYLTVENMEYLEEVARKTSQDVSVSQLVDAAIDSYVKAIKKKK